MKKRILSMTLITLVAFSFQLIAGMSLTSAAAPNRIKNLEKAVVELIGQEPGDWQVFIKDLKTKDEIIINSKPGTSASLIKIWVADEVLRQVEAGIFSLEDKIVLDATNKAGGSGTLKKRPDGTQITYREALELMMVVSDNSATNILVEKVGWENLHNMFKKLGCNETTMGRLLFPPTPNPAGGYPPGFRNVTSVKDLGIALEKLYYGQAVSAKADTELLTIMKSLPRGRIAKLLPEDIPVARKGGSLIKTKVMHDAGIIYGKNTDIIVAVMSFSNNQPTTQKRSLGVVEQIGKLAYEHLDKAR